MYRHVPPALTTEALHQAIYAGAIVRFRALAPMVELAAFTRGFLEARLAPHPPTEIHAHLDPASLAETLSETQRAYANASEVKRLWRAAFEAAGLDPADTARDRLVVRFQPPLAPGGEPHRARSAGTVPFHRDTWGTNLYAQVNWWAPVWPITERRTFAFWPELFDRPLANDSAAFDLADAMDRHRNQPPAAPRAGLVPRLLEPAPPAACPVVIDPGEVIAFSAQHAHAGVPNDTDLTRISLETRTLRLSDHAAGLGAPNVDGRARWSAPGLFRRLDDGKPLDAERLRPFVSG